jgi:hypothetical protein
MELTTAMLTAHIKTEVNAVLDDRGMPKDNSKSMCAGRLWSFVKVAVFSTAG